MTARSRDNEAQGAIAAELESRGRIQDIDRWILRLAVAVVFAGAMTASSLLLLKARGTLDKKLAPLGFAAAWTEFPSGPPLLETLNVGALNFGTTGESPPIFAQEGGSPPVHCP